MTDNTVSRLMDTISQVEERLAQLKAEHSNLRAARNSVHEASDALGSLVRHLETTNALLKEAADVSRALNMEEVLGRINRIGSDLGAQVAKEQVVLADGIRMEASASNRLIAEGIASRLESADARATSRTDEVTRTIKGLQEAISGRFANLESRLEKSMNRLDELEKGGAATQSALASTKELIGRTHSELSAHVTGTQETIVATIESTDAKLSKAVQRSVIIAAIAAGAAVGGFFIG